MSYWARALLIVGVLGAAFGRVGADPAPAASPPDTAGDIVPRFTVEWKELDIWDGAARLSEATGLRLHVPPETETPFGPFFDVVSRHGQPPIDYRRKASFQCKDATYSTLLREFVKAYSCRLYPGALSGGLGDVVVVTGATAINPPVRVEGYEVGISYFALHDQGRQWANAAPNENRVLHLEFSLRALNGDPSPALGVGYLRLTDPKGRTTSQWEDAEEDWSPAAPPRRWNHALVSAFPDEQVCYVDVPWPYPGPRELRGIEGDLILSRRWKRLHGTLPMPEGLGKRAEMKDGPFTFQLDWGTTAAGGFSRPLRLVGPKSYPDTFVVEPVPRISLELADGRRIYPEVDAWRGFDRGEERGYFTTVRTTGLPSPAVRLHWEPGFRSTTEARRVHFKLADFPAHLERADPAPKPPTGGRVPPPGTKRPLPAGRQSAPGGAKPR